MSGALSMDRISSFHQSGSRYRFLRIVGALFTMIGVVELAISGLLFVFAVYTLLTGMAVEPPPGVWPFTAREVSVVFRVFLGANSLLWSCAFLLSGLYFGGLGGVIQLLLHLEKNMRAFAQSLDIIRMRLASRGERVEPVFRS
jgi:hypothetical protein